MSVGSSCVIYGKDPRFLKRALASAAYFRKHKSPWTRFTYRKNKPGRKPGWTFWRVR